MRTVLAVVLVASVHFVLMTVTVATSFASGMARFDTGAAPGVGERVLSWAANILLFPLAWRGRVWVTLPAEYRGAPWEYLLFVANSLLWGAVIYALWRLRRRRNSDYSGA